MVARIREETQSPGSVLFLDKDIIGVVGGDGEDANAVLGQQGGDLGEDADEGKVQHPFYAKGPSAVVPLHSVRRDPAGGADQGIFLVGLGGKGERALDVGGGKFRHFADGKGHVQHLNVHKVPPNVRKIGRRAVTAGVVLLPESVLGR